MKKFLLLCVLGICMTSGVIAQTSLSLPAFKESNVVMRVFTYYNGNTPYIYITDGTTIFDIELNNECYNLKKEREQGNTITIAKCINQLKTQGYTMIASSAYNMGEGGAVTHNYFQKE
jgi:hypothetical protein